MAKFQRQAINAIRISIIGVFVIFAALSFFYPQFSAKAFLLEKQDAFAKNKSAIEPEPEATPRRRLNSRRAAPAARGKYSQFSHDVKAHRQSCDSCHEFPSENWKQVRKTDAFPDITEYPRHESCLNCHRQQFFKGNPPQICSICHTNPSPRNATRRAFPNPREVFDLTAKGRTATSDFAISFPHDKHIEIVSQNAKQEIEFVSAGFSKTQDAEKSCAVCHQTYQPQGKAEDEFVTKPPANLGENFWLKKGTFKTSPISHAKCFSCHSQETGILPAPSNCAACHQLKPAEPKADFDARLAATMKITDKITLHAWRSRNSSGKYSHDYAAHSDLSCSTCHNVAQLNTLNAAAEKVAVTSCSMCHITATAADGGALNTELEARQKNPSFQCVKCHVAFGKSPVPESHIKAVEAAGK